MLKKIILRLKLLFYKAKFLHCWCLYSILFSRHLMGNIFGTVFKQKCNWFQDVSGDIQGFKQYYNDIPIILSNNRNCCFTKLKKSATLMIIQQLFLVTWWSTEHMSWRIWYNRLSTGHTKCYQWETLNILFFVNSVTSIIIYDQWLHGV
jgi:hypothetical protein